MRTYLQIIHDVYGYNLRKNGGYTFTENDLIEFYYYKHDTGRHLDIYLKRENNKLHVYHDNEWFFERYKFNDKDEKFGYLVEGPWVKIINDLFIKFEQEIEEKINQINIENQKQNLKLQEKEQQNIEYFRNLF